VDPSRPFLRTFGTSRLASLMGEFASASLAAALPGVPVVHGRTKRIYEAPAEGPGRVPRVGHVPDQAVQGLHPARPGSGSFPSGYVHSGERVRTPDAWFALLASFLNLERALRLETLFLEGALQLETLFAEARETPSSEEVFYPLLDEPGTTPLSSWNTRPDSDVAQEPAALLHLRGLGGREGMGRVCRRGQRVRQRETGHAKARLEAARARARTQSGRGYTRLASRACGNVAGEPPLAMQRQRGQRSVVETS
jgi:hypothetical protein